MTDEMKKRKQPIPLVAFRNRRGSAQLWFQSVKTQRVQRWIENKELKAYN